MLHKRGRELRETKGIAVKDVVFDILKTLPQSKPSPPLENGEEWSVKLPHYRHLVHQYVSALTLPVFGFKVVLAIGTGYRWYTPSNEMLTCSFLSRTQYNNDTKS